MIYLKYFPTFSKTIEVDVQLNSIPIESQGGKDVVVNFNFAEVQKTGEFFCTDNNTFYTDSNGMEM